MNSLLYIGLALAVIFSLWRIGRRTFFFLHLAQLEGYRIRPYARWVAGRPFDILVRSSHIVGLVLLGLATLSAWPWTEVALSYLWCVAFASSRRYRASRPKKPFSFTPRARRLAGVAAVLILAVLASVSSGIVSVGVITILSAFLAADFLAPVLVSLALLLTAPIERAIQTGFKRKARDRMLAREDLLKVAITGSYGKTSVKFIVSEILSERFSVLHTPGSYNTPMGICKVINGSLGTNHSVLVLEMGIRHPGDIRELCEIVTPDIAVITSVGVAHLESMGSIDAIAREKGSILNHLIEGGIAVLNADDDRVRSMADGRSMETWTYSAEGRADAQIRATEISVDRTGTSFTVTDETDDSCRISTSLLGLHNVSNVLAGVAVGRACGLRLRSIKHAIDRVRPVPHRLALRREADITILDDAFNSNPVGARNALDVLGAMSGGTRYLVTPGMVELGAAEAEENRDLGTYAAERIDVAILVGPERTQSIADGLRNGGFDEDRILSVRSLFEARDYLRDHQQPGDVVLYENDLPDQYDEA